jgi:hypothetical protein
MRRENYFVQFSDCAVGASKVEKKELQGSLVINSAPIITLSTILTYSRLA